jgi:hypothetical protein
VLDVPLDPPLLVPEPELPPDELLPPVPSPPDPLLPVDEVPDPPPPVLVSSPPHAPAKAKGAATKTTEIQ